MYQKIKIWCVLCLTIISLVGCKKEPMIDISKETQASIDAKESQNQKLKDDSKNAKKVAKSDLSFPIDKANLLPQGTLLEFSKYIPYQQGLTNTYESSKNSYQTVVELSDSTTGYLQIRENYKKSSTTKVYQLFSGQLNCIYEQNKAPKTESLITQAQTTPIIPANVILAQPLTVGTTWLVDQVHQSSITNLYESIDVSGSTYKNIIEVTTQMDDEDLKQYYAENIGLIATIHFDKQGNQKEKLVLAKSEVKPEESVEANYEKIKISTINEKPEKPMLISKKVGVSVTPKEYPVKAWMEIFVKEGWLTRENIVNNVTVAPDVVQVDFGPGIIESLNQHPLGDDKVMAAMIQTLADYYQVKNVKLTVNGNFIYTNKTKLPQTGIWMVDPSWTKK